jgi:hypothetical protein
MKSNDSATVKTVQRLDISGSVTLSSTKVHICRRVKQLLFIMVTVCSKRYARTSFFFKKVSEIKNRKNRTLM